LIEAARRCFAERGYGGASIGDIVDAAGFTKGAFYSNFESKEAVLLELLKRQKARTVTALGDVLETEDDLDKILDAIAERISVLNSEENWGLLAMELQLQAIRSAEFGVEFRKVHLDHIHALGKLLESLFRKAGRKLPLERDSLAAAFVAMVQGVNLQRWLSPGNKRASLSGRLVKVLLRGLLTGEEE
jgi:AcrR family transcriptional regulator